MLRWYLHFHRGGRHEGRWGDAAQVREAAARAGVRGLVYKNHAGSSADEVSALPPGAPTVIPSIVLNHGMSPGAVADAITAGVRWIWGPSRKPDGTLGWDLPLPRGWNDIVRVLLDVDEPIVLATSHLDAVGRHELASLALEKHSILCAVTHSLYLSDFETRRLAGLGAVFEVDLYTMTHAVREHRFARLAPRTDLVHSLDSTIYLTSDAGQAAVGDPYDFVRRVLNKLRTSIGCRLDELAGAGPERVATHLCPAEIVGEPG